MPRPLQVQFQQPVAVEQVRTINPDWQITRFGEANEFVIRMPAFDQEAGQDAAVRVREQLEQRERDTLAPQAAAAPQSVTSVSPTVVGAAGCARRSRASSWCTMPAP